jgi:hypothetical protein
MERIVELQGLLRSQGDGVTDCTDIIQRLINAQSVNGEILVIPGTES